MLEYEKQQKVIDVAGTKIGGQPGENPPVMVATVFYANHAALLDEKTGNVDRKLLETELHEYTEIIEDTGMQGMIDVVGAYPDALVKECKIIADLVDYPFLVDGLNDSSRIPALKRLGEIGLLDRAILNSIDESTKNETLQNLKSYGVKNAVLLTFGNRYIYPEQKIKFLEESLLPKAEEAGIENVMVDTAVLDLPSISINAETVRIIKTKLGLPAGFAPANAIYAWNYIKKYGESARCGAIASLMSYCVNSGGDFVLFGPVKFAKCIIPAQALISGVNAYYRKRILRKNISEWTPLKKVF
jgi:tetrahydromethanopterin S-methyltransferase subunit H